MAKDRITNSDFDCLVKALKAIRALRQSGNYSSALRRLIDLEQAYPKSGLLWQERAMCLKAQGNHVEAERAFHRAVELNDSLADSWRSLYEIYSAKAATTEALRAVSAIAKIDTLPTQLLEGSSRLSEQDIDGAERLIRAYLTQYGPHLDGMRLLAQVSVDRKRYDDAELLLEAVLDRDPEYHEARYELGMVFILRRRFYPALLQAQRLLLIKPTDFNTRRLYASACDGLGRYAEALFVYEELLSETPENADLEFKIAFGLRNQGRAAEAVGAFRNLLRLKDQRGAAYAALADMKTYRFSDDEVADMREIVGDPRLASQHLPASFALGKALEDRKEYEESFRYYVYGNKIRHAEGGYIRATTERTVEIRKTLFTTEFFGSRVNIGCMRSDPIFIVGMPRAGSTLLEQILASHSLVDGTLELPEIPRLVKQFRSRNPDEPNYFQKIIADLGPKEIRRLGEIYLEETQVYRANAPFFVDKMPANFQDIGFIHLILPNAKIIDARREAMACCFSNFQQLFGNGQEFSYDLGDVGHYYRNYVQLMDHWDQVLPGRVLRVWHSNTVNDFELTVRRILDYCGLPFERSCLEFHKTERSVRTVSSEQVRQPINREGIDRWRNYEPWLGELKEALGPLSTSS